MTTVKKYECRMSGTFVECDGCRHSQPHTRGQDCNNRCNPLNQSNTCIPVMTKEGET